MCGIDRRRERERETETETETETERQTEIVELLCALEARTDRGHS